MREHLRRCEVASLHQDGRKGCLAVRFRMVDGAQNVYYGTLGYANLAKHHDLTASGIKEETLSIIRNCCSPRLRPPHL